MASFNTPSTVVSKCKYCGGKIFTKGTPHFWLHEGGVGWRFCENSKANKNITSKGTAATPLLEEEIIDRLLTKYQ